MGFLHEGDVADEITESQVAPADTGTTETGTATEAMDVAAPTDAQQGVTPPDSGTADASATAESAEAAPETEASRSKRRAEQRAKRQQANAAAPPAAPTPSPAEIIAAYERQKAAEQREAERVQQEHRRRAEYLGEVPSDPRDPSSPTVYAQLQAEANTPIPDGDDAYYTEETRALVRKVNAARAKLAEYDGRRGLIQAEAEPIRMASRAEALDWMGKQFERGLAEVGLDVQAVLTAGASVPPDDRMPAIVKALAAQLKAQLTPEVEDLRDELAAAREEADTWRRRAGGAAGQAERGGVPGGVGDAMTRQQFLALPKDQKDRIRRESPALVDEIYSRSA